MKLRIGLFACAALVALPAAAEAACFHNGVSYGVGAKVCQNGWLVECTPANYWKAVGQCLKDDGVTFTPISARRDPLLATDATTAKVTDKPPLGH